MYFLFWWLHTKDIAESDIPLYIRGLKGNGYKVKQIWVGAKKAYLLNKAYFMKIFNSSSMNF